MFVQRHLHLAFSNIQNEGFSSVPALNAWLIQSLLFRLHPIGRNRSRLEVPGRKCRISNRKQKSEGYRQSCQSRDRKGRILKSYFRSKNEESGEGWRFPEERLPDLESSFLWSIMGAGGSILLLPSCLLMIRSYFHALSLFDICLPLPF